MDWKLQTGIYQHGKLLLLVAGIYISLLTHRWEVTCAFFNISRLNKFCQYFKMVDKKNNVTFHISEQLRVFSPCKKKFHHMKRKNLLNFGLGIPDTSVLHKEEWRENSVKKSDITNWRMLAYNIIIIIFQFFNQHQPNGKNIYKLTITLYKLN